MPRVRLADVAARAGVTVGAASLALNGKPGVSPDTRDRVRQVARELGYAPHQGARAMSRGQTGVWGAVFAGDASIWQPWLSGAMTHAHAAGAKLMVVPMPMRERIQETMRQMVAEARLDGLVLLDPDGDDSLLKPLWDAKLPTVVAGRRSRWFDCVEIHDRLAMEQLLARLSLDGKRPIALVATRAQAQRDDPRIQVWHDHCAGIAGESPLLTVPVDSPEAGVAVAAQMLNSASHVAGALCLAGDRTAWGMLREARLRKISVPGELAIAGWGDLESSSWVDPELTTLHLPWEDLGARSAWMLQNRLAAPLGAKVHRTLDARLVSRRSA